MRIAALTRPEGRNPSGSADNNHKTMERMMNAVKTIEINARAKAFATEGVKTNRFRVESSGDVRVWDAVAGHFTNCHSLSEDAKRRIVKMAKESVSA